MKRKRKVVERGKLCFWTSEVIKLNLTCDSYITLNISPLLPIYTVIGCDVYFVIIYIYVNQRLAYSFDQGRQQVATT